MKAIRLSVIINQKIAITNFLQLEGTNLTKKFVEQLKCCLKEPLEFVCVQEPFHFASRKSKTFNKKK